MSPAEALFRYIASLVLVSLTGAGNQTKEEKVETIWVEQSNFGESSHLIIELR